MIFECIIQPVSIKPEYPIITTLSLLSSKKIIIASIKNPEEKNKKRLKPLLMEALPLIERFCNSLENVTHPINKCHMKHCYVHAHTESMNTIKLTAITKPGPISLNCPDSLDKRS